MRGKVKWFNDAKGYGFIEGGSGDVFVHQSTVVMPGRRTLEEGQQVEFEVERTDKGLAAKNVIPVR